jgi:16S rRNA (uracil1498-N3)-methyltransferase
VHRFHAPGASSASDVVALPEVEAHHLARVLRLEPGAMVRVFDGHGAEWDARVATVSRGGATVELIARATAAAEPPVHVTLAIGILKGDQMDTVMRDATSLGVSAIVPLATAHVTVPERAWQRPEALERWQRVVLASAKQCGRAVLPAVSRPAAFAALFPQGGHLAGVIAVEPARGAVVPPPPNAGEPPARATLLIGPEGGWSAAEVEQAIAAGVEPLTFGPRTLRAELAPTVALSLLWARWGWT